LSIVECRNKQEYRMQYDRNNINDTRSRDTDILCVYFFNIYIRIREHLCKVEVKEFREVDTKDETTDGDTAVGEKIYSVHADDLIIILF